MNLFGFAIGEVACVKPLDRNRGWLWRLRSGRGSGWTGCRQRQLPNSKLQRVLWGLEFDV